jgi:hypothetical protein
LPNIQKPILPNFLIVGAAKCGMTSLHYSLKQHPDVFMSTPKEPDFFFAQFSKIPTSGIGDDCQNVVQNFDEYCRLFERAVGKKAIGEASHTNLYYYRKTIPLIKQCLGDPKIIIILRNPAERAFAAYAELALEGREFLPFEEALRQEPKRIAEGWRPTWYYQDLGFYVHQVKAYFDDFSAVKVCLFDDLKQEPGALIQDLYRFLEVDTAFRPDMTANYNISGVPRSKLFKRLFSRKPPLQSIVSFLGKTIFTEDGWDSLREKLKAKLLAKTTIKPETKRDLENLYRNDIAKLQILINRDLTHWLNDPAMSQM